MGPTFCFVEHNRLNTGFRLMALQSTLALRRRTAGTSFRSLFYPNSGERGERRTTQTFETSLPIKVTMPGASRIGSQYGAYSTFAGQQPGDRPWREL